MTTPSENPGASSPPDGGQVQLDLFPPAPAGTPARPTGISRAVARASVSPGWWPLVELLYNVWASDGLVVHVCHEADGTLALEAELPDGAETVAPLLQRIRARAARTCGCCGVERGAPYRRNVAGPTRVACGPCRERLGAGEAYLVIADEYWRLDGSRRVPPLVSAAATGRSHNAPLPPAPLASSPLRPCTTLPPEALRATIAEIRAAMLAEIVGQDKAVARLALLAGLHVGGGLSSGGRALVLGPSGVGKTATIDALRHALEVGGWDVPVVVVDALELTSPGWSGAPSIGDLISAAIAGAAPDSPRARRAVIVIDEIHHAGVRPDVHGNMAAKRQEVLASLLGLVGHGSVQLGDTGGAWSSREALVIAMGAFTGLLDLRGAPSIQALVHAGLPLELATRFEEVVLLRRLPERELRAVLRRWPALGSLTDVCERLGYTVRIHAEAYARAARAVVLGQDDATARTAGGWLVAALREVLIAALAAPDHRELVVAPDSLPIPASAARHRPPDDPPDSPGGWARRSS
ncbi:ATPase AAA-2 domain protein [Gemmatirosa kalamazoonensis]|uniref:ATPase AAA-2 domain protein n=1 Tax=Gemmatirosa kalamazoonensis TaxID=861299 RepID=W0RGD8_9BACT|nr:ATP-binding protein [Gemmatirosa kalamazoonensis]AHG89841.1 ATPase AAA-2 domain protein [Gemmatirosa kalamazoonensis]